MQLYLAFYSSLAKIAAFSDAGTNAKLNEAQRLVDKPETSTHANESEQNELGSLNSPNSFGSTPAPASYPEAHDTQNKVNYASYVARLWIAISRRVAPIWNGTWGFLDKHSGSITAIATVFIVLLAFLYVRYSKRQWSAMEGQLEQMRRQLGVQKRTAIEQYGNPDVNRTGTTLLYLGKDQTIRIILKVQNDGTANAANPSIAVHSEFLKTPPPKSSNGYDFASKDFQGVGILEKVDHGKKPEPISITKDRTFATSPEEYAAYMDGRTNLFIWGQIRYQDVVGDWQHVDFCRYIKAANLPFTPGGGSDVDTYSLDCGLYTSK